MKIPLDRTVFYLLLVVIVPTIATALTWLFLQPQGFWQKLVMSIISIPEWIIVAYLTAKFLEVAIDK